MKSGEVPKLLKAAQIALSPLLQAFVLIVGRR
jgi:hypothetical protein